MALEYTCYAGINVTGSVVPQIPNGIELTTKSVNVTASSTQSDAFPSDTQIVILQPAEDCRVAFGDNPTAVNTGNKTRKLKADQEYAFGVKGGMKLAVIQMEA